MYSTKEKGFVQPYFCRGKSTAGFAPIVIRLGRTTTGFAVLFSVLVASLVLAIGISIFNVAFKELILTSQVRDSQIAFYAADAGAECALFWDTQHPGYSGSAFGSFGGSVNITSGLVGHWKFNDGSGSPIASDSARGNHGTLVNMDEFSDWVPGKVKTALDFDGSNDYVAIQDLFYQDTTDTAVTVTAWIRTTDGSNHIIASFDRSEYWRLEVNGAGGGTGQIGWDVRTSSGIVDMGGTTRVDDGEWHHVAGVFDNGALRVYVDGSLDGSASGGATFGSGVTRYGFIGVGSEANSFDGAINAGTEFSGAIDGMRIYNRALSQEEVGAVMAQDSLAAHWTFNEGTGLSVSDASGNGNTATLVGTESADWVSGQIGTAIDFDSDGEYLRVDEPDELQAEEYTYAFWIYPTEGPTGAFRRILVNGNGAVNNGRVPGFWLRPGDMALHFMHSTAAGSQVGIAASTRQLPLNRWTHIAGVSTGDVGTMTIYIDGQPSGSVSHAEDLVTVSGQIFRISTSASNNDIGASVDDVRIYNTALSQNEIDRLTNLGAPQNFIAPVAQGSGLLCNSEDITDPLTGWDSANGWDVSGVTSDGGTTVFDMEFSNGTCASVTVVKDSGATTIESRGRNTCNTDSPRRVERALRVEF